jgi:hypothetical protein
MKPKQYTKYSDGVKITGLKDEVNETIKKIHEKRKDKVMAEKLFMQYPGKTYVKPKTK